MRTVYKYPMYGTLIVDMATCDKVVLVAEQDQNEICIWVEHELDAKVKFPRAFEMYATGEDVPEGAMHQGTALLKNKEVWHIYEVV